MEAMTPFVQRTVVSFGRGEARATDGPTWPDVEKMLRDASERSGRVDLQTESGTERTVFAEKNAFHVTISVGVTDYYFASDPSHVSDETTDIFGHSFDGQQVIADIASVMDVAKAFWSSGQRSESVRWLHETIDG